MNTIKTAPGHHLPATKKWLAGLLVASALGCGAAEGNRGTITLSGGRSVPVIILGRNQSDISTVGMRNYIFALDKIVENMAERTIRMARIYGEPPFEGALNALQAARISREVAEEFVGRCNAALTSREVSQEEIEYLANRYAFARGLLVDAILKFREGLGAESVQNIPSSLGYPQIDLSEEL